jgi:hypothetical protein
VKKLKINALVSIVKVHVFFPTVFVNQYYANNFLQLLIAMNPQNVIGVRKILCVERIANILLRRKIVMQ